MAQYEDLANKIKNIFEFIFDPFKKAWETTGQSVINAIHNAFNGIKSLCEAVGSSFAKIWSNGTVQMTAELLLGILRNILDAIGNIGQVWANAWNNEGNGNAIIQNLVDAFNNLLKIVEDVIKTFSDWWQTASAQEGANAVIGIFKILSDWIKNLTENLKKIWENGGKHAFTSLLDAGSKIIQIFENVMKVIDPFVQAIENLAGDVLAVLLDAVGWVIDKFNEFADWILGNTDDCDVFAVVVGSIATAILLVVAAITAWNVICGIAAVATTAFGIAINILTLPITLVILAIAAVIAIIILLVKNWDWLKEKAVEIFTAIGDFISNIWNGICDFFKNIWDAIVNFIVERINKTKEEITAVFNAIKKFFENIWKGICDFFKNIWNAIVNFVTERINKTKEEISAVLNVIKEIWSKIWNGITTTVSNIWKTIKNTISNAINNAKNIISSALNTIKAIWENIWNTLKDTVTNIFNSIWSFIKNIINSILGGIEGMANGVINAINGMINAINKLHFDIPDWVPGLGGKSFGFNLPTISNISIPRLAKGGIVNQPTQAIIGEAGREAVLPLQNNTEWMDILSEKIAGKISVGSNDEKEIVIKFDGSLAQLIRVLKPELDRESKRRGNKLVLGGNT